MVSLQVVSLDLLVLEERRYQLFILLLLRVSYHLQGLLEILVLQLRRNQVILDHLIDQRRTFSDHPVD